MRHPEFTRLAKELCQDIKCLVAEKFDLHNTFCFSQAELKRTLHFPEC